MCGVVSHNTNTELYFTIFTVRTFSSMIATAQVIGIRMTEPMANAILADYKVLLEY
jgi:hypothetical protein